MYFQIEVETKWRNRLDYSKLYALIARLDTVILIIAITHGRK